MGAQEQWKSRLGYLLACLGMCIGTGNIWRFPRIAAGNGGGAFIIAWTIAMLIYAVPLLSSEMVMGRKARLGTIGAFRDFAGKKFTWMGVWVAGVCFLLMSYYCVVMAYCAKYSVLSITSFTPDMSAETTASIWNGFLANSWEVIAFHGFCMLIGCLIVARGVRRGIEFACKVMIPALLLILIGIAVYACSLKGAGAGLDFLFSIDLSYLAKPATWLNAFTQAAWSTGAGWGFIVTYAVYVRKNEEIPNSCFLMGLGDNLGGLIAGMAVIPAIFALSSNMDAANVALSQNNFGITFIYLFQLFSTIPGGAVLSFIFFFCCALAALTSLFAMIEVIVRNLLDGGMTSRVKATVITCMAGFIVGCFSAWTFNNLDNQDFVWGCGLMVSGLFFSLAVIRYGVEKVRTEEVNLNTNLKLPRWYFNVCIFLMPVIVVTLLVWWGFTSAGWYPDTWWKPFEVATIGTVLFQWAVLMIIALASANWFNRRISQGPMTKEEA